MPETLAEKLKAKAEARKKQGSNKLIPTVQPPLPETIPDAPEVLKVVSPEMSELKDFDPQVFVSKLTNLHTAIESKAPGIQNYLRDINKNLNQYPELTHLLNEEQVGVVVSGLLFLSDTDIAVAATRKKRGKLEIEDLQQLF